MLNTHHLHFLGFGNTAIWSVNGKFYFFGAVLLRWLDVNMFVSSVWTAA
jgi:hypothetical protein